MEPEPSRYESCEVPGLKQAPEILIFIDEDKVSTKLARQIGDSKHIQHIQHIKHIKSPNEFILWPLNTT